MEFIEEKTPRGITLKIFYEKGRFLAFDTRGKSVFADDENKNMMHQVLLFVFLGENLYFKRDYEKNYTLLKIQKGKIIAPFYLKQRNDTQYIFIPYESAMDMLPIRMMQINNIADMVRELDINIRPDFIFIDDNITSNDIIIIKNRYKIDEKRIIPASEFVSSVERTMTVEPDDDKMVNINMMSQNPVYLARIHLRTMDLTKISQLLLDFELTALDTEYIINFISESLRKDDKDQQGDKNRAVLLELKNLYSFYHYLLQKNDDEIKDIINNKSDLKVMTAYRTLISKVKSIYPRNEEQILYTEYENIIMDKLDELKAYEKEKNAKEDIQKD